MQIQNVTTFSNYLNFLFGFDCFATARFSAGFHTAVRNGRPIVLLKGSSTTYEIF